MWFTSSHGNRCAAARNTRSSSMSSAIRKGWNSWRECWAEKLPQLIWRNTSKWEVSLTLHPFPQPQVSVSHPTFGYIFVTKLFPVISKYCEIIIFFLKEIFIWNFGYIRNQIIPNNFERNNHFFSKGNFYTKFRIYS